MVPLSLSLQSLSIYITVVVIIRDIVKLSLFVVLPFMVNKDEYIKFGCCTHYHALFVRYFCLHAYMRVHAFMLVDCKAGTSSHS